MDRRILDYQLANAKHAMEYLKNLSEDKESKFQANRLFNHALAIHTIMETAEQLNNYIAELHAKNVELENKLRNLENSFIEPYVNNHLAKLKNQLIEVIKEFPDFEY